MVNHLYLTSNGIFGIALGVVATYVFHYVLFGVMATRVGLGRFFIDIATALAGRFAGGPAKVSIFASGLFGMISGSSIANTVTVGSLTIPMMIRIGYPRHFAGAVESTAATGGQITPPIMGAAAFLMVEYLALPYQTIIIAAIVPAFMHFFGVFCQVHFEAKKLGMRGMTADELPKLARCRAARLADVDPAVRAADRTVLRLHALSRGVLGHHGLHRGRADQPQPVDRRRVAGGDRRRGGHPASSRSGPGSSRSLARQHRRLGLLRAARRRRPRTSGRCRRRLRDGRQVRHQRRRGGGNRRHHRRRGDADRRRLQAVRHHHQHGRRPAGLTGAFLPAMLFDAKGLTLFYTLVMTAIVCILLGCGVPTTPTYIIMVTVAAPALAMMGVAPMVSHFFVFYYGVLADITPPVALAAYAGASMAGADPFKTGNTAFRLGLAKALVPFVFVYSPAMLLVTKGFTWAEFFETTTRLHGRHRHAGGALTGLRPDDDAPLGAAAAGVRFRAGDLAQPRGNTDRARGRRPDPRAPDHRAQDPHCGVGWAPLMSSISRKSVPSRRGACRCQFSCGTSRRQGWVRRSLGICRPR